MIRTLSRGSILPVAPDEDGYIHASRFGTSESALNAAAEVARLGGYGLALAPYATYERETALISSTTWLGQDLRIRGNGATLIASSTTTPKLIDWSDATWPVVAQVTAIDGAAVTLDSVTGFDAGLMTKIISERALRGGSQPGMRMGESLRIESIDVADKTVFFRRNLRYDYGPGESTAGVANNVRLCLYGTAVLDIQDLNLRTQSDADAVFGWQPLMSIHTANQGRLRNITVPESKSTPIILYACVGMRVNGVDLQMVAADAPQSNPTVVQLFDGGGTEFIITDFEVTDESDIKMQIKDGLNWFTQPTNSYSVDLSGDDPVVTFDEDTPSGTDNVRAVGGTNRGDGIVLSRCQDVIVHDLSVFNSVQAGNMLATGGTLPAIASGNNPSNYGGTILCKIYGQSSGAQWDAWTFHPGVEDCEYHCHTERAPGVGDTRGLRNKHIRPIARDCGGGITSQTQQTYRPWLVDTLTDNGLGKVRVSVTYSGTKLLQNGQWFMLINFPGDAGTAYNNKEGWLTKINDQTFDTEIPYTVGYDWDATQTISSGTYNSTTGVVTLTMSSSINFGTNSVVTIASLTGTGGFASINGKWVTEATTSGTTVTFKVPTGLGATTITGGNLTLGDIDNREARFCRMLTEDPQIIDPLFDNCGTSWVTNKQAIRAKFTGGRTIVRDPSVYAMHMKSGGKLENHTIEYLPAAGKEGLYATAIRFEGDVEWNNVKADMRALTGLAGFSFASTNSQFHNVIANDVHVYTKASSLSFFISGASGTWRNLLMPDSELGAISVSALTATTILRGMTNDQLRALLVGSCHIHGGTGAVTLMPTGYP